MAFDFSKCRSTKTRSEQLLSDIHSNSIKDNVNICRGFDLYKDNDSMIRPGNPIAFYSEDKKEIVWQKEFQNQFGSSEFYGPSICWHIDAIENMNYFIYKSDANVEYTKVDTADEYIKEIERETETPQTILDDYIKVIECETETPQTILDDFIEAFGEKQIPLFVIREIKEINKDKDKEEIKTTAIVFFGKYILDKKESKNQKKIVWAKICEDTYNLITNS